MVVSAAAGNRATVRAFARAVGERLRRKEGSHSSPPPTVPRQGSLQKFRLYGQRISAQNICTDLADDQPDEPRNESVFSTFHIELPPEDNHHPQRRPRVRRRPCPPTSSVEVILSDRAKIGGCFQILYRGIPATNLQSNEKRAKFINFGRFPT